MKRQGRKLPLRQESGDYEYVPRMAEQRRSFDVAEVDEFEEFKTRVRKNRDEAHVMTYYAALLAFALATAFGRLEGIAVCGTLMIVSGSYALGANGNEWSPAYRRNARSLENMTPEERATRARFAGAWLIGLGALFVVGSMCALFAR